MMKLTRRNFLKTISTGVTGIALASHAALVWGQNKKQSLRRIGCGKMSNVDLSQYYRNRAK